MNAFSPASEFTIASGATLNLAGFDQTIGSLEGPGNVTLGSAELTVTMPTRLSRVRYRATAARSLKPAAAS
jgi:hypothetical protein